MPSTYTLNNGITLIATGEQSGAWGATTNVNLELVDTALDGQVTVTLASAGSSGSPNALAISDGAASNGRNRMVIFDDGGDLGATAYVQLTPNDSEKIIYVRNALSGSRSILLFQGTYNASNDYEVPAGTTAVVYFNGGGTGAVAANVFNNAYFDGLRLGSVSVTAILDEDNMSSDSATALATQQSIKAYVDSQVGTVDTLAEILANGNTTGGTDIVVSSGDVITTNTINETTAASGVTIDSLLVKDGGITAAGTSTFAGQTITNLGAVTTADINGGTIDGTVIGGSSPAAISGTTGSFSGNLTVDTNTLFVDAASNRVGIGTSSPASALTVSDGTVSSLTPFGGTALFLDSIGSNYLQFGSGTSSSPAIYFGDSADGDVGGIIYAHASNAMSFRTNGSERMRIDSAGNVGIGTTTPTQDLHVEGGVIMAATGADYVRFDAASLVLNRSVSYINYVGTGTLLFRDVDSVAWLSFSYNSGNSYINLSAKGTGYIRAFTGGTERMRIDSSGNVGIGTTAPAVPLHISSATPAIRLTDTDDNSDAQVGAAAGGLLVLDADIGNEVAGTAILFRVDGGSEKMRIDSSGNVGIGTSSPLVKLDVYTSSTTSTVVRARNDTTSVYLDANNGYSYLNTFTNHPMLFGTNNTERMRITSAGDVGIGTASPDGKLDIATGGTTDVVAALGGTFPAFTYRNGTGAWFHAGKHPSSDYFYIGHGATPTTSVDVVVDSGGRLITGNNASINVLSVEAGFQNYSGDGYITAGKFAADAFAPFYTFLKSRNATVGAHTIVQNGDDLGTIAFTGSDGTNFIRGAQIRAQVDGTPGTNDMPGRLTFFTTADGASSPSERMRIDSSGNVGIATSSPSPSNSKRQHCPCWMAETCSAVSLPRRTALRVVMHLATGGSITLWRLLELRVATGRLR
jgi:hypothetical protein